MGISILDSDDGPQNIPDRQRLQYLSDVRGGRGRLERSLPFQEGDQFLPRKTRLPKQGKQGALRHVAVMPGHDGAAF